MVFQMLLCGECYKLHLMAYKLSIFQHLERSNIWNTIVKLFFKHPLMFLGSRARPVRRADNLTAICYSIV
jgi:hypothetical protein